MRLPEVLWRLVTALGSAGAISIAMWHRCARVGSLHRGYGRPGGWLRRCASSSDSDRCSRARVDSVAHAIAAARSVGPGWSRWAFGGAEGRAATSRREGLPRFQPAGYGLRTPWRGDFRIPRVGAQTSCRQPSRGRSLAPPPPRHRWRSHRWHRIEGRGPARGELLQQLVRLSVSLLLGRWRWRAGLPLREFWRRSSRWGYRCAQGQDRATEGAVRGAGSSGVECAPLVVNRRPTLTPCSEARTYCLETIFVPSGSILDAGVDPTERAVCSDLSGL
jgi:hypothetical protein